MVYEWFKIWWFPIFMIIFILGVAMWYKSIEYEYEYEHIELPSNINVLGSWTKDEVWSLYYYLKCLKVKEYHPSYKKCMIIKEIWLNKEDERIPDPVNTELLDQIGD